MHRRGTGPKPILKPNNRRPSLLYFVQKLQGCFVFAARVAEHRNNVGRQLATMRVDDLSQHEAAGATAAYADESWALNEVRVVSHASCSLSTLRHTGPGLPLCRNLPPTDSIHA
jgi:hypothetical protein